jgi:small subunit ribosomal protein S16
LYFLNTYVNISRMLMIRLQRTGRKHEPTFRVVLTDSKNGPKSGKYLENLGWYDTRIKNKTEQMDTEMIKKHVSNGAQLSLTLHNYLVGQKVIEGKKKNALPKRTPIKKEVTPEAAAASPASAPSAPQTPASAPAPEAKEEAPIPDAPKV